MTRKTRIAAALVCLVLMASGLVMGQQWWQQPGSGRGPGRRGQRPMRQRWQQGPPTIPEDRAGVPDWKVDPHFKDDVFTFVRVEYSSSYGGGGWGRRGWGGGWDTDFPDSDLNFSFRLQQLTSLKVNPQPITLKITDDRLFDYPFLYMIEPGRLEFSEDEVKTLRRYLLNGGFLMVDDFWGEYQWRNFYEQIKRVFPDREPEELKLDDEIFRCVYRLKEKPQVPSIHTWQWSGLTWEDHGPGSETVHYKGIFDDKGRMMSIICHNTDLGDGWEREGESPDYFKEFSEKKSYPMGINIVTYAMTH
jgi:Domain of unknown function (DUF4159)